MKVLLKQRETQKPFTWGREGGGGGLGWQNKVKKTFSHSIITPDGQKLLGSVFLRG